MLNAKWSTQAAMSKPKASIHLHTSDFEQYPCFTSLHRHVQKRLHMTTLQTTGNEGATNTTCDNVLSQDNTSQLLDSDSERTAAAHLSQHNSRQLFPHLDNGD